MFEKLQLESPFSGCQHRAELPGRPLLRACYADLQTMVATRIRGCLSGGMPSFNSGRAVCLTSQQS